MTEKTEQPFILNFDSNHHAVIEPDHDQAPFRFHSRLLYAFVPKNEIDAFLDQHLHRTIGEFESVSFSPKIYEVELNGEYFTLCQAPLGGPASVQLLDWLISYGVKQVLTVGNAGALTDLPENEMLLVKRAIRDEGTSFHYMEPGQFIDLNQGFLKQVEDVLATLDLKYDEIFLNCVFEEGWTEADATVLFNQLVRVSDEMIEKGYFENISKINIFSYWYDKK